MHHYDTPQSLADEHSTLQDDPHRTIPAETTPFHNHLPHVTYGETIGRAHQPTDQEADCQAGTTPALSSNESDPIGEMSKVDLDASEVSEAIVYLNIFFQHIADLQQTTASLIHALVTDNSKVVARLNKEGVNLIKSTFEVLQSVCRSITNLPEPIVTNDAAPSSPSFVTLSQGTEPDILTDSSSHSS